MAKKFFAAAAAAVLTAVALGACDSSELDPPKYNIVKNGGSSGASVSAPYDTADSASADSESGANTRSESLPLASSRAAESASSKSGSSKASSKSGSSKAVASKSASSKSVSSTAASSREPSSDPGNASEFKLSDHYSDEVITVPASVTELTALDLSLCTEVKRFEVAAGNPAYCSVNGVLFSRDMTTLIKLPRKFESDSYTVPDSVTKLAAQSIYGCKSLKSITLPDGLSEIGRFAFNDSGVVSITIPASVEKVDVGAFQRCIYMKDIYVAWKDRPSGWHRSWNSTSARVHRGE